MARNWTANKNGLPVTSKRLISKSHVILTEIRIFTRPGKILGWLKLVIHYHSQKNITQQKASNLLVNCREIKGSGTQPFMTSHSRAECEVSDRDSLLSLFNQTISNWTKVSLVKSQRAPIPHQRLVVKKGHHVFIPLQTDPTKHHSWRGAKGKYTVFWSSTDYFFLCVSLIMTWNGLSRKQTVFGAASALHGSLLSASTLKSNRISAKQKKKPLSNHNWGEPRRALRHLWICKGEFDRSIKKTKSLSTFPLPGRSCFVTFFLSLSLCARLMTQAIRCDFWLKPLAKDEAIE